MHTVLLSKRQVMTGTRAERRAIQEQQKAVKALAKLTSDPQGFTTFLVVRHGETDWNKEHRLQGHTDVELNDVGRLQALQVAGYFADRQSLLVAAEECSNSHDDGNMVADMVNGYGSQSSSFDNQQVAAIYSSDLARATQTATAIGDALKLQVHTTDQLRERHLGILQGLTRSEAAKQHPAAWAAKQYHQPPSLNTPVSNQLAADVCSQTLVVENQPNEQSGINDTRKRDGSNGTTEDCAHGIESLQELSKRVVAEVERIAAKHTGQTVILVTHGGVIQALHLKATGQPASSPAANCRVYKLAVGRKGWAVIDWSGGGPATSNLSDGFGGGVGGG